MSCEELRHTRSERPNERSFLSHVSSLDLRSANLTPSTPPLSPKPLLQSPPLFPASDSWSTNPSIAEEPSEDAEAKPEQENTALAAPHALYQTTLPPSVSFPQTAPSSLSSARRNSQPTRTPLALRPTARPLSPSNRPISPSATGSFARPLSPTSTGMSTASSPAYLHSNTTGTRFNAPLRPSFTGNVGAKKTFGPSPGFSGTPSCPRCNKAVYFAEQVRRHHEAVQFPLLGDIEADFALGESVRENMAQDMSTMYRVLCST